MACAVDDSTINIIQGVIVIIIAQRGLGQVTAIFDLVHF